MNSIEIWSTSHKMQKLDYPPETIWEIVVNAVIHRDYSISDNIQIKIFDNRIEIMNPGRLPRYIKVDNILDSRFSPNPKIVITLKRYKIPPNKYIRELLNNTFQKMK